MKLILKNKTIPIKVAKTYNERMIGLIGKTNINYGMLFLKCNAIHTFFMKEEIDVIGLNSQNEVIFIKQNVKKNKMIIIYNDVKKTSVLELPKNTSHSIKIGDRLLFKN
jgi:hypothetical protein